MKKIEIDMDYAYEMRKRGCSLEQIGIRFGVSYQTIRKRFIDLYGEVPTTQKTKMPKSKRAGDDSIGLYDQFIKRGRHGIWVVKAIEGDKVHLKPLYKHRGVEVREPEEVKVSKTVLHKEWGKIYQANVKTYSL